jgi:predicted nucleic acid-binding Zn ribbon protein
LNARQKVLAQWRGHDLGTAEKARARTAKSLGQVMPGVLAGLRMDQRQAEAEIARVWNHLIDPTLTAHAHPTGIRKGTLFVSVDSSVWLDEIVRYRRREILERLQHSFGRELITRISFRVG